ncbi:MAG TPA: hemolysin III family protein [Gemmatimonadales bacterium]|nr:hemolysin III family protein [Gemmatimonadales bacterium]
MSNQPDRKHDKLLDREPVNGWLHFGGALLAAVGLVALAIVASEQQSWRHMTGAVVFGTSALLMFAASANYHLTRGSIRESLYRRLDHSMIYVFIAGTFTPVCLVALEGSPLAIPLLITIWVLALLGVTQKLTVQSFPRRFGTVLYLALGWLGMMAAPVLLRTSQGKLLIWLLVGGLLYTAGSVFYWAKWPRGSPGRFGFHELWHVFVLAASGSHYWAVMAYIIT